MVYIIRIKVDGSMEDQNININKKNILNILTNISENKGENNISIVNKLDNIYFYGWKTGNKQNKHILPNSDLNLYGDIFILKIDKKIKKYTISEYGDYYYFVTDEEEKKKNYNKLLDEDTTEYILK